MYAYLIIKKCIRKIILQVINRISWSCSLKHVILEELLLREITFALSSSVNDRQLGSLIFVR